MIKYTFVSIVHKLDQPLLEMQARSLAQYLHDPERNFIQDILVIDNSDNGTTLNQEHLLSIYGPLAPRVRFMAAADVAYMPAIGGWFTQQALKLLSARVVTTPRYILLDAKNHAVNPIQRKFFENVDNGRMRSYTHGYGTHPLLPYLINTLEFYKDFGLTSIDPTTIRWLPSITPYAFDTQLTRNLLRFYEQKTTKSFGESFFDMPQPKRMTEFFMYAGYILSLGKSFKDYYDLDSRSCPVLWHYYSTAEIEKALLESELTPFFSAHRGIFCKMEPKAEEMLANFWVRKKLLPDIGVGLAYIKQCAATMK